MWQLEFVRLTNGYSGYNCLFSLFETRIKSAVSEVLATEALFQEQVASVDTVDYEGLSERRVRKMRGYKTATKALKTP